MLAILVILAGLAVWSLALLPLGVRRIQSTIAERAAAGTPEAHAAAVRHLVA